MLSLNHVLFILWLFIVQWWGTLRSSKKNVPFICSSFNSKISMIRKYHNHILQTNPLHREKEPQNTSSHKTSERQLKQSEQLSLLRQYDCKTILAKSSNQPPAFNLFSWKREMTWLVFLHLKYPDVSCTLDSKDIDKMFNSTCRMPIWIVVPPFSKFTFWHNLWVMTFRNNPLSQAKRFHFKIQNHIEHSSAEMNTTSAWDSLLLAKVSKLTPPSNANSCEF